MQQRDKSRIAVKRLEDRLDFQPHRVRPLERVKRLLDRLGLRARPPADQPGQPAAANVQPGRDRAVFKRLGYLVVASGTSTRHVKSVADEVVQFISDAINVEPKGSEEESK